MNFTEQIFLILLQSYPDPRNVGEDQIQHLQQRARRIAQLYTEYSLISKR
jgi:hypothetical protein